MSFHLVDFSVSTATTSHSDAANRFCPDCPAARASPVSERAEKFVCYVAVTAQSHRNLGGHYTSDLLMQQPVPPQISTPLGRFVKFSSILEPLTGRGRPSLAFLFSLSVGQLAVLSSTPDSSSVDGHRRCQRTDFWRSDSCRCDQRRPDLVPRREVYLPL